MKVGFKTGPKNWEAEGQALAREARACEVWFDVRAVDSYKEMLAELAHYGVEVGLHHWGLVDGKYKTNLATNYAPVRDATVAQIKQTIDVGESIGCGYVNAHPGARFLEELQFSPWQQRLVEGSETSAEESRELFLTAVGELQHYAQERGVLLTIETLPGMELRAGHGNRENAYPPGNVPLDVMIEMTEQGGWLANDITHTAGQVALEVSDQEVLWQKTLAFSEQSAAKTRLLHINTVEPPLNGTDSHHGITAADFTAGVFPQEDQVRILLGLFTEREDVFVIPEPQDGAAKANFEALQVLVEAL